MRRCWAAPDAAAKSGDVDPVVIRRIERHTLDVRERQIVEGLPGLAVVLGEPKTGSGCTLGERHVDPSVTLWMEVTAESLSGLTPNPLPCPASVFGTVQTARPILPAYVTRADENDVAVGGVHGEILGIQEHVRGVDLFPCFSTVGRSVKPHALTGQRFASGGSFGTDHGKERAVDV